MSSSLVVNAVSKQYTSGNTALQVLNSVSFRLESGTSVAIVGPSGSGKTTLLGLCAGLDTPSSGEIELCGHALQRLSEDERAEVRNRHVGFVFQSFQLLPTLTALENVMVPLELRNEKNIRQRAEHWLEKVGLGARMHHYPSQLSGGEQQRVAIARAFINEPDILFADEPTGNLDTETGNEIEALLFNLNKHQGTILVLVTHDVELASKTQRILRIHAGSIVEDRLTAHNQTEATV